MKPAGSQQCNGGPKSESVSKIKVKHSSWSVKPCSRLMKAAGGNVDNDGGTALTAVSVEFWISFTLHWGFLPSRLVKPFVTVVQPPD